MVQFDLTLLIQAFNFIVLLAFLNKFFFQPIIKIQKERNESLDAARHATETKLKDLNTLREQYEQKLAQARQDAFELVSQKVDAATQERNAQLDIVNTEIDEKLNETKAQVAEQEKALKDALGGQVSDISALILSRLTASEKDEVTA